MPHQDSPHVCIKCENDYCHVCELWCTKCGNPSDKLTNRLQRHEITPKHKNEECTCFIKSWLDQEGKSGAVGELEDYAK